ncbi:MAG: hypothetical protein QM724_01975 [Flavobacteriales bacterium]
MDTLTRTLLVGGVIALGSLQLQAQLYPIPDPAFAEFLQANYPQVMVDGDLDTSDPDLVFITSMIISDTTYRMESLDGLQFFTGLDSLMLYQLEVYDLPLPDGIKMLELYGTRVYTEAVTLPSALRYLLLMAESRLHTYVPLMLPAGLEKLRFWDSSPELANFVFN